MQKNKIKIISLIFAFLITAYVSLTYISTGSFNVFSFGKSVGLLFSKSQSQNYDKEYIGENKSIIVNEPNGVGTISHDYTLPFKDFPKDVVALSLKFDPEKSNLGNVSLIVVSGENSTTFSIPTDVGSNATTLVQVGITDIDEIRIFSRFDQFGGSVVSNEEIVSISSIKINADEDIQLLKEQFFFDLLKGIIVSAVIWLVVFLIIKSKADAKIFKKDIPIEKAFLIAALSIGVVFSFLFPVYQVPDEQTHINIIYEELNWDINIKTQEDISNFADTIRVTRNYDQKVNFDTYFNNDIKAPLPGEVGIPSIKLVRHLPQAIGIVLFTLLRAPLWMCVAAGELFALLSYAFLGYLTIKIMPLKKEIMTVIMLLPVCLQEFPSLSYDSFLLSSYFLLFAYILYVKFTKEKFTLLDIAVILGLTAIVAITKIPYALVVLLIITIPISKIDFNFGLFRLEGNFILKHKIIFSIILAICLIGGVAVAIKILPYIGESKTFLAALQGKRATIRIIWSTLKEYFGEWLVQITGDLGWFDTPVALIFTVFVVSNMLFINLFDFNNTNYKCAIRNPFKKIEIVVFILVATVMFSITVLSMFGWTMKAYGINVDDISVAQTAEYLKTIPIIGGLQGRYFVPIIPLVLIPWYFPKVSNQIQKINHKTYLYGYHLTSIIYLIVVLLKRYWI